MRNGDLKFELLDSIGIKLKVQISCPHSGSYFSLPAWFKIWARMKTEDLKFSASVNFRINCKGTGKFSF